MGYYLYGRRCSSVPRVLRRCRVFRVCGSERRAFPGYHVVVCYTFPVTASHLPATGLVAHVLFMVGSCAKLHTGYGIIAQYHSRSFGAKSLIESIDSSRLLSLVQVLMGSA